MDTLTMYRKAVEETLSNYIDISYAYGDIQNEAVFDYKQDRYIVMSVGWHDIRRIHGCLLHIDIIDGKVWIQRDGTEDGIAYELEEAGIPKHDMVLGFQDPAVRQYTEYAVV